MKTSVFVLLAALSVSVFAGEFGVAVIGTSGFKTRFNSPSASGTYANDPGALTHDSNHAYDNGYVRDNPDTPGLTPDWDFGTKSQVTPIGGNYNNGATIAYSSDKISGDGVNRTADDPGLEPGVEVFFRDLPWKSGRNTWGYMIGLTCQRLSVRSGGIASFRTEKTTDTYTYSGVFPNVGDPNFPVPFDNADPTLLLPDVPVRTIETGTASYPYMRRLEADLVGVKAGPCWEVRLSEDFALALGAGVSAQWIQSEFTYSDGDVSGKTRDDGCLLGAFLQGDLEYAVTDRWRLFAGAEWMTQESFSQSVNGYASQLNGNGLITGRLGVAYSY